MASTSAVNRLAALLRDTIVGLVRRDEADLSARQLAVLLICSLESGPHTVRGLAERLDVVKPAVTRALDRLETSGLARRAPDPRDGRSVLVTRTQAGAAYVAALRDLMQTAARASGSRLTQRPRRSPPDPNGGLIQRGVGISGRPSPAPGRRTPPP